MNKEFKVSKIGTTSNDKLFATIVAEAPVKQEGILKVRGRITEYRIGLSELPEGVELKESRIGDGKLFTKDVAEMPPIIIKHFKPLPHMPMLPVDYNVEEREVILPDGSVRIYKWLVLKDA